MMKLLLAMGLLVVGCAIEKEQTSGTLTVDRNSGVEIPEGVTVSDADLNSDGVIDITDLVIVSKFFGQEVYQGDDSVAGNLPEDPDGYVYALITAKINYRNKGYGTDHGEDSSFDEPAEYLNLKPREARFAVRLKIEKRNGLDAVVEINLKPVDSNPILKKPVTQSLDSLSFPFGDFVRGSEIRQKIPDSAKAIYKSELISGAEQRGNFAAKRFISVAKTTVDGGGNYGEIYTILHYAIDTDDKKLLDMFTGNVKVDDFNYKGRRTSGLQIGAKVAKENPFISKYPNLRSGWVNDIYIIAPRSANRTQAHLNWIDAKSSSIPPDYNYSLYNRRTDSTAIDFLMPLIGDPDEILPTLRSKNYLSYECWVSHCSGSMTSAEVREQYFPEDVD